MKTLLLIDSDLIARRAIAKILREQSEYRLIISGDPGSAVQDISHAAPDLLLLGVKPTEVEEIALLSTIKIRFPDLPVVILSERSEPGAALAIAALRLGAIDVITKPADCNSMLFADRHLAKRLLPIVKTSLKAKGRKKRPLPAPAEEQRQGDLQSVWPLNLIVVGGCTGGPPALFRLIETLPENFAVPVVVVQHFPRYYTKVLAHRLDELSALKIREAQNGVPLKAGTIWIAPGGYHTEVFRTGNETQLKVHRGPRENGVRPSIDLLFRSAARLYGPGALGVILSGYGTDGIAGAGAVRQAGGHVLVQDHRSALVGDLPLAVIKKRYCDAVIPVEQMLRQFVLRDEGAIRTLNSSDSVEEKAMPVKSIPARNIDRHLFSTLN
ncbi:chemotaxis protein CheB [Halalkalibaculum sp. DA3122]|uniref:chemotaxis protein CheB n=1 Tax=unclassified Halalkalibaculum TaxID=2964617 RepID=UPI003754B9FC